MSTPEAGQKSELYNWIATQLYDPERILREIGIAQKRTRSSFRAETPTAFALPGTEVERTIAAVWQEVLNIDQVGIYDNFFDLGGRSLLLVQVNSRLRKIFQRDLAMLDMLRYPTVSALAAYLEESKPEATLAQASQARVEHLEKGKQRLQQRLKQRREAANR